MRRWTTVFAPLLVEPQSLMKSGSGGPASAVSSNAALLPSDKGILAQNRHFPHPTKSCTYRMINEINNPSDFLIIFFSNLTIWLFSVLPAFLALIPIFPSDRSAESSEMKVLFLESTSG